MKRWIWTWHRWTGFALLLPLLWWMGTSVVMSLWAIEHVRGNTWASGKSAEPVALPAGVSIPSETLAGATSARVFSVEGHALLAVERPAAGDDGHHAPPPDLRYLETGAVIGGAIPSEWAVAAAKRDFRESAEVHEVWLYTRDEMGARVWPAAPGEAPRQSLPEEYAGPLPAYAVHLDHDSGMRLYVDAITGQVRTRRTDIWRSYDLCFRLHALDIVPDGVKRAIMLPVLAAWFFVGATGLWMWWRLVITPKASTKK